MILCPLTGMVLFSGCPVTTCMWNDRRGGCEAGSDDSTSSEECDSEESGATPMRFTQQVGILRVHLPGNSKNSPTTPPRAFREGFVNTGYTDKALVESTVRIKHFVAVGLFLEEATGKPLRNLEEKNLPPEEEFTAWLKKKKSPLTKSGQPKIDYRAIAKIIVNELPDVTY